LKLNGAGVLVLLTESGLFYVLIQMVRLAIQIPFEFADVPFINGPLDIGNMTVVTVTRYITVRIFLQHSHTARWIIILLRD
jgi:hypothetical protein